MFGSFSDLDGEDEFAPFSAFTYKKNTFKPTSNPWFRILKNGFHMK